MLSIDAGGKGMPLRSLYLTLIVATTFIATRACYSNAACPLTGDYCNISFVRVTPTTALQLHVLKSLFYDRCHFHLITPRVPTLFKRNAFILTPTALQVVASVTRPGAVETRATDLSAEFARLPRQLEHVASVDDVRPDAHYYTLPLLYASWARLAEHHRAHVTALRYGSSWGGRPLLALHVSPRATGDSSGARRIVLVTAALHAREWATVSAADRVLREMLTARGMRALGLRALDVVVVPMANPDGYAYSRDDDRLWRRNRPPRSGFKCAAVDLHLNFPSVAQSSAARPADPCSDEYAGPSPLSELESRGLAHLVASVYGAARIAAHLDLHSYGASVRAPWHVPEAVAIDRLFELDSVGERIADAMASVHGMPYAYNRRASSYKGYFADWVFSHGVLSYTVSIRPVRDTDFERAFALPADEVRAAGDEVVAAVEAIIQLL